MMPFYPFPYYRNSYRNIRKYPDTSIPHKSLPSSVEKNTSSSKTTNSFNKIVVSVEDVKENSNEKRYRDSEYFEIFGLKLYFDDILLICMIFFLYNEGVEDQLLFISLVMLLLS